MRALSLLILLTFVSCASKNHGVRTYKRDYAYTDSTGKYDLVYKVSQRKKNQYYSKTELYSITGGDHVVERSTQVSRFGVVKGPKGKTNRMLRPEAAKFTVWFDKKPYQSELRMDPKNKRVVVRLTSPEKKFSGVRQKRLPTTKALYCFFHQLVPCIQATGFFEKSQMKKGPKKLKLYIIWDGYPYMSEQYNGVPNELITNANFRYERRLRNGHFAYSLNYAGQRLFYRVNKSEELEEFYWISEGISQKAM